MGASVIHRRALCHDGFPETFHDYDADDVFVRNPYQGVIYMPSVFLNLSGSSVLPEHERQILRELARETPDHDRLKLVVGNREYEVSYIPWLDGFSISYSSLSRSAERVASQLEMQLNGGRTFSQVRVDNLIANPPGGSWLHHNELQEKVSSCAFTVNKNEFPCQDEHLECPVTLCVPDKGVFVKISLDSNVCCLFDYDTLNQLVTQDEPHPISRKVITERFIVPRDECHFDTEQSKFVWHGPEENYTYL
ncbi:T3SS effector NleG family protein [Salmonella enterica]|nr:DUF1076 domain-containing protein [Salmonella enterica]EGY9193703.1 DUF1076 domain-containing protein [Salmonella enterica]EIU1721826.1 T3SS effector NleG family protein [Salmonella enterica]EKD9220763.1 T3SS effector NleG family protein [Salmonella enterica]EKI6027365.1 T3SS effector NleG family protein [Salmonella enterica]